MPTAEATTVFLALALGATVTVAVVFLFLLRYLARGKVEGQELGISYLVKEKGSNRGFYLLQRFTENGTNPGMIVSRTFPEKVRKEGASEDVPVWWLSREENPKTIDPLSLAKLTHTIKEFIEKRERSVVLLDGLEYLILQNGFEVTLRFLQALNDLVILNKAMLIVPVDPSSFSTKELSLLEKEMEVHRLSLNVSRFFGQ